MKPLEICIALIFVFAIIIQPQTTYGQTESRIVNPDWTIDEDWTMNAPVASGKTIQDAILKHNSSITSALSIADSIVISSGDTLVTSEEIIVLPGGQLHIWGEVMLEFESIKLLPSGMIHIHDGGQLMGMADVELKALSGEFIIDEGGSMVWTGDWKNNGGTGTTVTINGTVTVKGDLENKIEIVGDGSISVQGTLNNFPNASIFGCSLTGDACCLGAVPCLLPAEDPLPVELLSFDVQLRNDKVLVEWLTSSEFNHYCFMVERSIDLINWKQIDEVLNLGKNVGIKEYEIWDMHPIGGISYYRLMQKDLEGSVSAMGIEAITFIAPKSYFSIFPNPASSIVFITLGSFESAEISVLDYTGRCVDGAYTQAEQYELDVSTLETGIYIVQLRSGDLIESCKLIVN